MHGNNKLDVEKALKLRAQGLSNVVIARRLGVTDGAVYLAFRRHAAKNPEQKGAPLPRHQSCSV